jgi:hypothetical protein
LEAINESIRTEEYGKGLQFKKQDDFIDEDGNLQEKLSQKSGKNFASRYNGYLME